MDKFQQMRSNKNDIIVINPKRETRIDMKMNRTENGYFVAKNEKINIFERNKDMKPRP